MIGTFAIASESGWVLESPVRSTMGCCRVPLCRDSLSRITCLGSLALHERDHDVESQQMPLVRQA